jgi:hypothetical protein
VGLDDTFDKVEPYELDETCGQYFKAAEPDVRYQKCDNHADYKICTGMVDLSTFVPVEGEEEILCFACRFNETIAYNSQSGLSFDFTTDRDVNDHFASTLKNQQAVFTGHDCCHLTINLAEADGVHARIQSSP